MNPRLDFIEGVTCALSCAAWVAVAIVAVLTS